MDNKKTIWIFVVLIIAVLVCVFLGNKAKTPATNDGAPSTIAEPNKPEPAPIIKNYPCNAPDGKDCKG